MNLMRLFTIFCGRAGGTAGLTAGVILDWLPVVLSTSVR